MEKIMRYLFALALVAASLSLSACNTTEGVGRDLKSAGRGVENTAADAKN